MKLLNEILVQSIHFKIGLFVVKESDNLSIGNVDNFVVTYLQSAECRNISSATSLKSKSVIQK